MFSIKRKIKTAVRAKKLPYFRFQENDQRQLSVDQLMPKIEALHTFKSSDNCIDLLGGSDLTMVSVLVPDLPMLAKPVALDKLLNISEYIYEEKYDGERMLSIVSCAGKQQCFTRTLKLSFIFKNNILLSDGFHNCIFDGELVYLDQQGNIVAICDTGARSALQTQYMVFDVQIVNGSNVSHLPLLERKALLSKCLLESDMVKISEYTKCTSADNTMVAFDKVFARGGEGLMLKHSAGCYAPNRREWVKLKSLHIKSNREEFELYAYKFKLDKNGVSNILDCGYFDRNNKYVHVSNVSSGINNEMRLKLKLLSDSNTGLFYTRLIVTIIADKITTGKSLRHPSLYRIRTDLDDVDVSKFV